MRLSWRRFTKQGVKNDKATIARALQGTWRDEHLFELAQAFQLYQTYQMKVTQCDKRVEEAVGYGGWQVVSGRRTVASRGHSSGQLIPFMVALIGGKDQAWRDQTIPYPTSYPSRSRKPVESYRGLQCRMSLLSRSCSFYKLPALFMDFICSLTGKAIFNHRDWLGGGTN